ncbi:MAG: hypothetical protein ACI9P5_000008 [Saprospiraceae bacterium]|jgi:hypothetical protein
MICKININTSLCRLGILIWLLVINVQRIHAQVNINCEDASSTQTYSASAFFNYGSASDLYNSEKTATITVGQISTQLNMFSLNYKSELGFWGQFLLPPLAPYVQASEGNLGDRVEITWDISALSPVVTDVFKVYRNGTFLDEVENDERVYVDYNVVAGEFYTYTVRGVNKAGIGKPGSSVGFLNPNGTITGQVTTINGNPVSECSIDLSPTLGSSLRFNGDGVCFADYSPLYDTTKFSATLWVRQDSLNDIAGLLDLGSSINKNWYIHTLDAISGRGINVGVGGGAGSIDYIFPNETKLDWHHVAVTYNGNTLLLYVDGDLSGSMVTSMTTDSFPVYIGATSESTGYYKGLLDEVIIYNKQLTQTEIRRQMNKSISSRVDGLVSYWKMDEGRGTTTYDLTENENRLYMCGPSWSEVNSPITNSSLTDENGYYILEGINYGSGETFTVRPAKNIYESVSIEFNAANEQYASLAHFDISETDTSTLSYSFNLFDLNGTQTLLSKGNDINLKLVNGELILYIDGVDNNLGAVALGWHQIIMVNRQDGSNSEIAVYLNGSIIQTISNTLSSSDSTTVWALGANLSNDPPTEYFTGLIDELVAYEEALTLSEIQTSNNIGTDEGNPEIYVNYPLNEAQGDSLYNLSESGGVGYSENASWANDSKHLIFTGHEFLPSSKIVTLNSTNTSTDQVDFTDLSTIPVSGYVRFKNTDCFADSVEILVNGFSASPPIFTNQDGYFIAELEPGASVKLSPRFFEHKFSPAFFEVKNAISPVAGVLFLDRALRSVDVQLAGGDCKKSIIPDGTTAKLKVRSENGCFEKIFILNHQDHADGKIKIEGLPPMKLAFSVPEHSDITIQGYFSDLGGSTLDLTLVNDSIDFIYYSDPIVSVTQFGDDICGNSILEQFNTYNTTISITQDYYGESCPVESAQITIVNNLIQDGSVTESHNIIESFDYSFPAGPPNIAAPYTQTLEVSANANGKMASSVTEVIILGRRKRDVNFTSTSPNIPLMILHDPPGDGSYSYIRKGEKNCTTITFDTTKTDALDRGITYSYGPDFIFATGIGFSTETSLDVTADLDISYTTTSSSTQTNSGEICMETLTDFSTDQGEYLVGDTSDLYIGGALNILFGVTDILRLDSCTIVRDTGVSVYPDGFETNFFYTEYEIQKIVIPNLLATGDQESADAWGSIVANNNANKQASNFVENISFGSGVNIEKSTIKTETNSNSYTIVTEVNSEIAGELGLTVNGVGAVANLTSTFNLGKFKTTDSISTTETTIGYRLSDNDPGDLFTVNISNDPVYGTPVFNTVSGVSSCPYEDGTVKRDEVSMTLVSASIASNIRENDAAIFNFNLGNVSQTEENREYIFSLRSASNVNGAEVKIAGADPLDTEYFVPFGESIPVTVSVERSNTSYIDTLIFDYFVQCENDRNVALGIGKSNTPFNATQTVNVNFVEPCSSVDISSPAQDWVVTPFSGPVLPINLVDYDVNDLDLDLMRLQYRRSQGDGSWINIAEVPKDSLGILFELVDWDTGILADGLYEIRALAVCVGGLDVGISHVIKGKIERTPPELFGTAEPADGVLSRGDEISITFNEPIQCNNVILAAGIGANIDNNNLGMYNTETGNLIDFTMSCSEDKIILVPNVSNSFLENKVIRVELDSILDLVGNKSGSLEWEFVVDQNSLNWLDKEDVKVVKYEEDFVKVERRIENRGGFNITWELDDVPEWSTVYPSAGDLAPGDVQVITFEFDQTMVFGRQIQTIQLSGPEGDEPMVIDARVVCPEPIWEVTASDWEYAMNITAELDIEGEVSIDEEDILAAYIDDKLRGVGKVEYYPIIDKYLVFLTIYSNSLDPDVIDMRIWDASSCLLFSPIVESFTFESDDLIGTPLAPQVLHTSGVVLKEVVVNGGWNWLSFNLALEEPSPDSVLVNINDPINGIFKSQTEFAQYADGFGWFGSLNTIGNVSSYQLRINNYDTLLLQGNLIDPDTVDIPISIGWNWIGYTPRSPLPINTALDSITLLDGDLIKSQTEFAQFVSGFGWIGTLRNLRPNEGYILKSSVEDVLQYPNIISNFTESQAAKARSENLPDGWEVNPFEFEHNMTLTGIVLKNSESVIKSGDHLGVFHEGVCRGVAEAIYVEPLDSYLFFLTMYSNNTGEQLDFKLFDGDQANTLDEIVYFAIDSQVGEISEPYEFELLSTGISEYGVSSQIRITPNPIKKGEKVRVTSKSLFDGDVIARVFDVHGSLIHQVSLTTSNGEINSYISTNNMAPGLYQVVLFDDNDVVNAKFIVIR